MTIKECYDSKFWKEVEVTVIATYRPVLGNQMVTIEDESGQYVIENNVGDEIFSTDLDDEGGKQIWKLRCRNGILQGWNQTPRVAGETKTYRDYYGKGQENAEH